MRPGFTFVELMLTLVIVALLVSLVCPTFTAARRQAKLAVCKMQMSDLSAGLGMFAAANSNQLPPFAFHDDPGNLPQSGHWGGHWNDPVYAGRRGMDNVNLWRLLADNMIAPRHVACPSADVTLISMGSSYFPDTSKFSTYCLRMLYSQNVFMQAPENAYWHKLGLLGIYSAYGGGRYQVAPKYPTVVVPMLRLSQLYREVDPVTGVARVEDLAGAPILADTFWYRNCQSPAAPLPLTGKLGYPVQSDWCHENTFNVLWGDGSVRTAIDNGTVAANCVTGNASPPDDGFYQASYAIKVWRYFEDGK